MKFLNTLLLFIITTTTVFAAGSGEPHISDTIYPAINFVMYAAIIYWALFKKADIRGFFQKRKTDIENEIEAAGKEKKDAQSKFDEFSKKLSAFEAESKDLMSRAKKDGEELKNKIIQEAQAQREKILADAKLAAANEMDRAKGDLRSEVIALATDMALEMTKQNVQSSDQKRLFKDGVDSIKSAQL